MAQSPHLAILVGEPLTVSRMTRERHVEGRVGDTVRTWVRTLGHTSTLERNRRSPAFGAAVCAGVNLKLCYGNNKGAFPPAPPSHSRFTLAAFQQPR